MLWLVVMGWWWKLPVEIAARVCPLARACHPAARLLHLRDVEGICQPGRLVWCHSHMLVLSAVLGVGLREYRRHGLPRLPPWQPSQLMAQGLLLEACGVELGWMEGSVRCLRAALPWIWARWGRGC